MAENLNRVALGLNGLLQIKSGSGSPKRIGDDVAPTMEMLPFYAASDVSNMQAVGVAAAVGANVTLEIPSDETWYVHTVSGQFSNAGGANRTYALGLVVRNLQINPVDVGLAYVKEQLNASGAVLWVTWTPGKPLFFAAGTQFTLRVLDNVGGFAAAPGSDIEVRVMFNRFKS